MALSPQEKINANDIQKLNKRLDVAEKSKGAKGIKALKDALAETQKDMQGLSNAWDERFSLLENKFSDLQSTPDLPADAGPAPESEKD